MYLTDYQARGKFCPQSSDHERDINCTASECMHWRWGGKLPYAFRKKIVPEGVPTLFDLEEKARTMEDEEFSAHLEALEKQYSENEPPRPEDCPDSWEYSVDFEEWFEGYFIAWWEPSEDANQRTKDARKGYCGLSGKPYQLEPEE